jgi:hypothetical protein
MDQVCKFEYLMLNSIFLEGICRLRQNENSKKGRLHNESELRRFVYIRIKTPRSINIDVIIC